MSEPSQKLSLTGRILKAVGADYLARNVISSVNPTSGFFTPGQPMLPMGPAADIGRAWDYPISVNTRLQTRDYEGPSFWELRALAENHDITRLLIETRKDQIEALSWSFTAINEPKTAEEAKDLQKRSDMLEKFFKYPDGETPFPTWIRTILEDLLVIDAPTIYIDRDNPYETKFRVIDGATIKRLVDEWGRTPVAPSPAYQQLIKGLPAFNYTTEQMLYMPRNPRPNHLYGMSPVQQIVMIINIALRKELWQLEYFKAGNIPDMLIGTPESWTPDQIVTFQKQWDILHTDDLAERRKAKFVPGGTKPMPTREPILKDAFDEWLARVACYAFSIPPTPFVGANRAVAMAAQQTAEDEGLQPLRRWTKQLIDTLAQDYLGQSDIEFQWSAPIESDPQKHIAVIDMQLRDGLMTINEGRMALGRDPVDGGDVPLIFTSSGPIPVADAEMAWKMQTMQGTQSGGTQPRQAQVTDGEGYTNQEKAPNRPIPRKPQSTVAKLLKPKSFRHQIYGPHH